MAVITTAVIATAVALKAQRDNRKAQQRAASAQRRANIESAAILEKAGRASEADILEANALAIESADLAAQEAQEALLPFADTQAFKQAQDQIMGGLPVSGAIADSIRQASTDFIRERPEFDLSGPVGSELERQGDLAVSSATPAFNSSLLGAGQQGLAASSDIAQINQRGFQRLGDIVGSQAAQRASVLVGQTPELARLATGASEARLLGDAAGQQFQASAAESLAGLAGTISGAQRSGQGSGQTDEFGFKQGEDPFEV
jgi:hypothetical protein